MTDKTVPPQVTQAGQAVMVDVGPAARAVSEVWDDRPLPCGGPGTFSRRGHRTARLPAVVRNAQGLRQSSHSPPCRGPVFLHARCGLGEQGGHNDEPRCIPMRDAGIRGVTGLQVGTPPGRIREAGTSSAAGHPWEWGTAVRSFTLADGRPRLTIGVAVAGPACFRGEA